MASPVQSDDRTVTLDMPGGRSFTIPKDLAEQYGYSPKFESDASQMQMGKPSIFDNDASQMQMGKPSSFESDASQMSMAQMPKTAPYGPGELSLKPMPEMAQPTNPYGHPDPKNLKQPMIRAQALTPAQTPALAAISQKVYDAITSEQPIDKAILENDQAMIGFSQQQRALIAQNALYAQDHYMEMNRIAKEMDKHASGKEFWDDLGTGGKIARVLLGIVTLGGSESYIHAKIQSEVAADMKRMSNENNAFEAAKALGKTNEEAMAIDMATQSLKYKKVLDSLIPQYNDPNIKARLYGLQASIDKERSTAMMSAIKNMQEDQAKQREAYINAHKLETEQFNAQTSRGHLRLAQDEFLWKQSHEKVEALKKDEPLMVFDQQGKPIGKAKDKEEATNIQNKVDAAAQFRRALNTAYDENGKPIYTWNNTSFYNPENIVAANQLHSALTQQLHKFRSAKPGGLTNREAQIIDEAIPPLTGKTDKPQSAINVAAENEYQNMMRELAEDIKRLQK